MCMAHRRTPSACLEPQRRAPIWGAFHCLQSWLIKCERSAQCDERIPNHSLQRGFVSVLVFIVMFYSFYRWNIPQPLIRNALKCSEMLCEHWDVVLQAKSPTPDTLYSHHVFLKWFFLISSTCHLPTTLLIFSPSQSGSLIRADPWCSPMPLRHVKRFLACCRCSVNIFTVNRGP